MKKVSRLKRFSAIMASAILAAVFLAACTSDDATSAASCAYIVGTGENGNDRNLKHIVYPGQKITLGSNERAEFFPCNDRNWLVLDIDDELEKDTPCEDQPVGDVCDPIIGVTSDGTLVMVEVEAFFTLNQDPVALTEFYRTCHKHQCASSKEGSGEFNNSTEGWMDLLREQFGPALATAIWHSKNSINDGIWLSHDVDQYNAYAAAISSELEEALAIRLGSSTVNLFCGGGTSRWTDPSKPGEGEFVCQPVRINVQTVRQVTGGQGSAAANEQRTENAEALYGDDAGYWLGVQDTVLQCKNAGVTICNFIIGNPTTGSPGVSVPIAAPTPTPEPTAEPEE